METITDIREYAHTGKHQWDTEEGFQIVTSEQVITLAIDSDQQCCESWGYLLTEDDTDKFIGAELRGLRLTDTARKTHKPETFDWADDDQIMFVDIETDRGVLQFAAYNSHNGYYGHEARVSSKQLTEQVVL